MSDISPLAANCFGAAVGLVPVFIYAGVPAFLLGANRSRRYLIIFWSVVLTSWLWTPFVIYGAWKSGAAVYRFTTRTLTSWDAPSTPERPL